ncbi:hypothetical protein BJ508DRAFT_410576 [Ascobolus immersus RN42]|uniref:arginyltransferase n=1 Tax=Ascobolus immersus RN42 TaxID=1160509 RepID=A0A3N4IMQ9_ASCIM|nr:hypothetical protein BJ508DRAFT_410576 [Ascobolus immersus RN42]
MTTRTVISPQGYHTGKCGYCGSTLAAPPKPPKADEKAARDEDGNLKGSETLVDDDDVLKAIEPDGNQSYYVSASTLSVEDYQKLLDRGWRRSGKLLYKQNRKASCCPHYTIRLEASKFETKRDHRSTLNRWNKFVLGEEYVKQVARDAAKDKELAKKRHAEKLATRNATRELEIAKKAARDAGLKEPSSLPPKLTGDELEKMVHACEYSTLKTPPEPAHKFEITLEPSNFTEEKFLLFRKYQVEIHHEKPSKQTHESFKRFLCESPLPQTTGKTAADYGRKYGSFHQLYRLDGRLIAMAVLDLLPNCVSSVYFLYDTEFHKYSMGKLSACREIVLAREGGYKYYYLGYYIHRNKKMEYKANFPPSELLDPESNVFHPMEHFVPADKSFTGLNKYRYFSYDEPTESCRDCDPEDPGVEKDPYEHRKTALSGYDGRFHHLWDRRMPGITPLEDMRQMPLGDIHIRVGNVNAVANQLRGFDMANIEEENSIVRHMGEMAAVMGPDVVMDAVVEL